jgi:hypothetical protein
LTIYLKQKSLKKKKVDFEVQEILLEELIMKDDAHKVAFRRVINSLNDSEGAKKVLNKIWQKVQ